MSELNKENNKNSFQWLWVAIALQKWRHNTAKQQISSAKKTEAHEKHISKRLNILQPLQWIHEYRYQKWKCQKIKRLRHRRKMLVYLPSQSLQWEQAQQNQSCFWMQHKISKKITKQRTYIRSGLTNQVIRLLIRFRQELIAQMANIKWMFNQFRVPEKQQNFIRFL